MIRISIPIWSERVSPVFDVAKRLLIVDVGSTGEAGRREEYVSETDILSKARRVTELGVDVLICGAISRPLEVLLASAGIHVISYTCGLAEDVLHAFIAGRLNESRFSMPGCCGRRRQFQGRYGRKRGMHLGLGYGRIRGG